MTQNVKTLTPPTAVDEATQIMNEGYFRHLPVRGEGGRLVGIVNIRDLVRCRIRHPPGRQAENPLRAPGGEFVR